jgi:serine/threonine protein kinase/Tfp pilus assembly protein PilF
MSDPDYTIPISHSAESEGQSGEGYGYKLLNTGDILGKRYSILRELGSGGFATTYLAIDDRSPDKTQCVIKQLQPRFNSPSVWANAKERFATEAMVLQWLGKHQQIPQLLAHFEEDRQFYLVLEFIQGEELEQEIHRQVLNESQTIDFLIDVLNILDFVHQQGVIHRDIKPSNLIRRKDGQMALIDFGAVKELGTLAFDDRHQEPIPTQIIGTPGYMPPEQNNGKPVYSSDIYALGKTAIFAMTGRSPVDWEESESSERIVWHEQLTISQAFVETINRMTAPKIIDRYQNVGAVLKDLKPLLAIGKVVGKRYQIIKYLGSNRGIQSYIVSLLDAEDQTLYYLKILKPQSNETSALYLAADRITNELANFAKIETSPQIPEILEYFTDEEYLYLIQEYVRGESLAEIIDRQFILSEEEAIDLLLDAAHVLCIIHKQQIVHGNLQPSSLIRRNSDGKIAIVDFGSIQEIINLLPDSDTGYVPPEQIAGRATYASDIYALGMTAIHVLTGTSSQNLEKNPRTGEIIWHRKARISKEFAKILDRAICLDKRKRYQSTSKLIKDLQKIQQKSRFRAWYKYFLLVPVFSGAIAFGLAHWAQRVAILEFYKADLKLEAKQYKQAVEYYDNGLKRLPKTRGQVRNFEQVWLKKAGALNTLKMYDESLKTCNNALRYYQSYQLWNCKALALDSLKEFDDSIAAYNKAIELAPDYLWVWNNRGEAYAELGNFQAALADFQKAIELDKSKSFVPWNNIGKLYYQQHNYQKAIEAYQKALEVHPNYLPALIGLGNSFKSERQYSAALDVYERVLTVDNNSYEGWYGKGLVQESLQKYEDAKQSYEKAFSLKPDWEIAAQALQRIDKKLP